MLGQFGFRSQHPGGANFLFADGSVHFLKETIDMGNPVYSSTLANKGVYRNLSTRAGGEVISSDAYSRWDVGATHRIPTLNLKEVGLA